MLKIVASKNCACRCEIFVLRRLIVCGWDTSLASFSFGVVRIQCKVDVIITSKKIFSWDPTGNQNFALKIRRIIWQRWRLWEWFWTQRSLRMIEFDVEEFVRVNRDTICFARWRMDKFRLDVPSYLRYIQINVIFEVLLHIQNLHFLLDPRTDYFIDLAKEYRFSNCWHPLYCFHISFSFSNSFADYFVDVLNSSFLIWDWFDEEIVFYTTLIFIT